MRQGATCIGIHRHLTIRSSRPRVVASAVCYALRLHTSAAPPQGGLTQALGGRKTFDCFAFQCSFSRPRLTLLFGVFPAALLLRSSSPGALTLCMRCVSRFRKRCLVSVSVPRLTRSLRLHPAESSQVRVRAFPLRLSASAPGFGSHRHPPPPNNSFKPTPCRGIGRVLCATLAHVRRPATGRLNSSVRRQESVWWPCFPILTFPASIGAALRSVFCGVASSVKSVWRAHTAHALRWPASETLIGVSCFPLLTRSLRIHPAESSRVRVLAFPLRISASASGPDLHRRPPPPNNSFKPTPCRGVGRVLYATLAHVRRPATGRLNSGVRRQNSL